MKIPAHSARNEDEDEDAKAPLESDGGSHLICKTLFAICLLQPNCSLSLSASLMSPELSVAWRCSSWTQRGYAVAADREHLMHDAAAGAKEMSAECEMTGGRRTGD